MAKNKQEKSDAGQSKTTKPVHGQMGKMKHGKAHGAPPRGLMAMASPTSLPPNMTGRFGRMFTGLTPTSYTEKNLADLAGALITPKDPKDPKDGADGEESDFGAAYTYFGQFIDHDLTFDPSTFEMQKNDPSAIIDFRTPAFDLDNVYGRGPDDQPYLYDGTKFALGEPLTSITRNPKAHDVLRAPATSTGVERAIIGDPRNDENTIISQLQGMMYRFHNFMVDHLSTATTPATFAEVQREVQWHYQLIVLRDFLPKIVGAEVLSDVCPAVLDSTIPFAISPLKLKFYNFSEPVMPVEFSVAAYRLGHSMVRPGYRVHEETNAGGDGKEFLLPIFDHANPDKGLNAFNKFKPDHVIDWQRFIDLGMGPTSETDSDRVQKAYKIDTGLVDPLSKLPPSVAGDQTIDPNRMSLAFRNLLRGQLLLLPCGQDVARAMGIPEADILTGDKIFIATADSGDGTSAPPDESAGTKNLKTDFDGVFNDACPLWVYILAESRHRFYAKGKHQEDARLTGVGGRIVAETFLALMNMDENSVMHAPVSWKPITGTSSFTLADLLRSALSV